MIEKIAIVGAGNGGKAAAVDLALQGKQVRLFEFPEFEDNLSDIIENRTLISSGAVAGKAYHSFSRIRQGRPGDLRSA